MKLVSDWTLRCMYILTVVSIAALFYKVLWLGDYETFSEPTDETEILDIDSEM